MSIPCKELINIITRCIRPRLVPGPRLILILVIISLGCQYIHHLPRRSRIQACAMCVMRSRYHIRVSFRRPPMSTGSPVGMKYNESNGNTPTAFRHLNPINVAYCASTCATIVFYLIIFTEFVFAEGSGPGTRYHGGTRIFILFIYSAQYVAHNGLRTFRLYRFNKLKYTSKNLNAYSWSSVTAFNYNMHSR